MTDWRTSNVATVTIDVFAANDAPVAQGDQFTTSSANQLAGNVLLNDSDVDGDSLMAVSLAGAGRRKTSYRKS